jgi:hypothetical protein
MSLIAAVKIGGTAAHIARRVAIPPGRESGGLIRLAAVRGDRDVGMVAVR